MDLAGQLARHLDRIQRGPVVGIVDLLARLVGLGESLEGKFDVVGRQLAIGAGEFQAVLKGELDGLVVDLLDLGGGVVLPFGRARLEFHQALADGAQHVHLDRSGAVGWIEVLQILVEAHHQTAAGSLNDAGKGQSEHGCCSGSGGAGQKAAAGENRAHDQPSCECWRQRGTASPSLHRPTG
jgi:hypothetical protein